MNRFDKLTIQRHLISAVIVLVVLATAWVVFGQNEPQMARPYERGDWRLFQMLSPEEAAQMRRNWRSMSDEEKEEFRAEMRKKWEGMSEKEKGKIGAQTRERFSPGREGQFKAVKEIEKQLAKLKEAVEGMERETLPDFNGVSPEEGAKLRERRMKVREERQKAIGAIIAQIAVLQGQRQPTAAGEELIIVNSGELKAIRELAVKEKAEQTARRLESIVGRRMGLRERALRPEQRPHRPRLEPISVREIQPGEKAPAFTLNSFDGKTVSFSDYEGKIVVLEWLSVECPFVKYHYETGHTMVELANKYKDKNIVWLAVNSTSDTTEEANKEFAKKYKLPYPILDDRSGKVGLSYGAMTTPHMFIIDTKGNIVYQGGIDNSPMGKTKEGVVNYVDKALGELTSGKSVSVVNSRTYGCSVKYAR